MHGYRPRICPQTFLVCNLQATFLFGFLLNFASGLLWQRSAHHIVLVGQESQLDSRESKMSKILTIACVQAIAYSCIQIYIIFSARIGGYVACHPIFFVGLGQKSSK